LPRDFWSTYSAFANTHGGVVLLADLKVPFVLKGGFRQGDTPLHQALREALVNTLVHANYSDRASVRITKRPSGFEFRNPGLMRVPAKAALHGVDRSRIEQ